MPLSRGAGPRTCVIMTAASTTTATMLNPRTPRTRTIVPRVGKGQRPRTTGYGLKKASPAVHGAYDPVH